MNVIFMVNLPEEKKPGRTNAYQYSELSWKRYADRIGAELFVLRERVHPEHWMNANWHKVMVFMLLQHSGVPYDKVLIVDSDTIIHPDAPDIFEGKYMGKFYAAHNDGSYDWMLRSMENYSHHMFDGFTFPFTKYFNSGVVMVSVGLEKFFEEAYQFYYQHNEQIRWMQETYGVGTDQPVMNFLVHTKIPEKFELLPYEWNMQELPRREVLNLEMTFTHYGWLYHFNGIHPDFKINPHDPTPAVEQWMRYTFEQLYRP